jgi:tetratricopeptide (TPR) repeat protein
MVNVVNYLVENSSILDVDTIEVPRNIRQMIERDLQRLGDDDRTILEAASVAGAEFSAPAVAAALERPPAQIEVRCNALARREQFISIQGPTTWPDGTRGTTYRFSHALYQEVLYERAPLGTRDEYHRRIADREEAAYGDHATEIATELAHHYRQANNPEKSIHFFQLAAEQATARSALTEAEAQLRDAIALIPALPPSAERDFIELGLQTTLGAVLTGRSYGAQEKEEPLQRAHELCDRVTDAGAVVSALFQIVQFYISRMRMNEARALAERTTSLVQTIEDPLHAIEAWHNLGEILFWVGEPLSVCTYADRALALYEEIPRPALIGYFGLDWWIITAWLAGVSRLILGSVEQALDWGVRTAEHVRDSAHPLTKAEGLMLAVWPATFCLGDLDWIRRLLAPARQLAEEYGLAEMLGWCLQLDAYARFWQGERSAGLEQMIDAIARLDAVGSGQASTWRLAMLAEMYFELGDYRAAEETVSGTINLVMDHRLLKLEFE